MPYYFFAATLPMLALDAVPALSFERFLRLCDDYLSPGDLRALNDLLSPGDRNASGSPFVRRWRNGDTQIRNAVARHRAAHFRCDPEPFLREQEGIDVRILKAVSDAFARPSPLEREFALDRLRWQLLDELAGHDPFTGSALLAYALKLKIVARWSAMNREQGAARAEHLIERNPGNEPK